MSTSGEEGGKTSIPFSRPYVGEAEKAAVARALAGEVLHGDGPVSRRVERKLAALLGVRYAYLATSCTHALEMAMLALDVGPGDEVIMPSFTFVSTANAVALRGGRPVFADIEPDTLNLSPRDVARRITERTVGIVPVHYAGVACDMDALLPLAAENRLWVVEDAAQGIDAYHRGRALGSLGRAGCLSFHDTKNLTSGEGGAFVTDDRALAQRVEIIREKGTNRSAFFRGDVDKYTWVAHGSSYIMSDILAALLDVQLDRREEVLEKRRAVWTAYREILAPWVERGAIVLPRIPDYAKPNYHMLFLLTRSLEERTALLASLRAEGLHATFHFVPLHSSPVGREFRDSGPGLPVTERAADRLVRLPLYPDLADAIGDVTSRTERALRVVFGRAGPRSEG